MLRRDLLRWLAAGAGLGCLDGLRPEEILPLGRHVHDAAGTAGQELRALDAHANATVIAAAERILPRTDTPGATDAAVNLFIDRMLADWHTATERDRVLAGLRELDARSQARHGSDFIACRAAEQDALLMSFDDEVTALRASPRLAGGAAPNPNAHWFSMFKYLTVWGYFTSEAAMRDTLHEHPLPGRWDGCAPYAPRAGAPLP